MKDFRNLLMKYTLTAETNNYKDGKHHSTAPQVVSAVALVADTPGETLARYSSTWGKTHQKAKSFTEIISERSTKILISGFECFGMHCSCSSLCIMCCFR